MDFGDLDVVTLKDLFRLKYCADGQPRRLGAAYSAKWMKEAEELEEYGLEIIPRLTTGLRDFTSTSAQFKAEAAGETATTADMLKGARDMLKSVRAMCEAAEEVEAIISDGRISEKEIQQYIASLELIEGRAKTPDA